ncbi:MAG TPA: dihydropteroate synthase [Myxococcales bacterium]|nr:dihydropteroate synthase [Myxococcales bacterium]
MRLIELQNEVDAVQACALVGRAVPDANLRGWAALVTLPELAHGLQHVGLAVLKGEKGALALGSVQQIWSAARQFDGARELQLRAAAVESPARASDWKLPRSKLPGRAVIMGIVNVTPDSFSDGGAYDPIEHGLRLAEEGADILDIGGESTRPNAAAVSAAEERKRTEPVVKALVRQIKIPVSIDTVKPEVAQAAVDAGAEIVNVVSGDLAGMPKDVAFVVMHMRGTPQDMQQRTQYADLLGEIQAELGGPHGANVALDPGLGFAKTAGQNLTILRKLRELTQLQRPLLVGASRKSFIGKLTGRDAPDRLHGSTAAAVVAAMNGAAILRVHDVEATREALQVAEAVRTSPA